MTKRDPVAVAIAAAEGQQQGPEVQLRQINVTLSSSGRPAVVAIPVDASDFEFGELAGWLLSQVMPAFRAEREKAIALAPKLHTPSGIHLVPPA